MARLPAWARSYSCPHERFDAETTDQIVTEYAKEYCARFVDRFGNVVEGQSPNLIPFLRQGLSKFDEFEGAWDVAVGYTRRTLLFNNQNDAPRQAAWLGLRMTECGAGGEWEATLPHPTRLRWDRWLLPPARWLSVRSDGRHFRQAGIKRMNFLLPDVSHDTKQRWYGQAGPTPVADYLIPIFDEWVREDDDTVFVRIFWGLLRQILGGAGETDLFGNPRLSYVVVETDGAIEALDALRVCKAGLGKSGLNVLSHDFDDLAEGDPFLYDAIHSGVPLCAKCQACPERELCGGGYLPHRYARANGFDNPSVWCADILKLVAHMRDWVARQGKPRRKRAKPAAVGVKSQVAGQRPALRVL